MLAAFGAEVGLDAHRDDATRPARPPYRWSYALTIGRSRLVVLDNRAGRHLEPGRRTMLSDAEWRWFADALHGEYDHLVVGSSLPWLMAPAIHEVEATSERLCDSPRRWVAGPAERVRRALDLEHWAAFGRSFEALGALLAELGSGSRPPATICVLSGDVHHSYAARPRFGPAVASDVCQLVCSPMHNALPPAMRLAVRAAWSRTAAALGRGFARLAGTPPPGLRWDLVAGPYHGNAVGTLLHDGDTGHAIIERTDPDGRLRPVLELDLGARSGDRPGRQ